MTAFGRVPTLLLENEREDRTPVRAEGFLLSVCQFWSDASLTKQVIPPVGSNRSVNKLKPRLW